MTICCNSTPNEDDTIEENDKFWEQLHKEPDESGIKDKSRCQKSQACSHMEIKCG